MQTIIKTGLNALIRILVATTVAMTVSFTATADQKDPRLGELFTHLGDDVDESDAARITNEIWQIWHQVEDAQVQSRFDQGLLYMGEGEIVKAVAEFGHVIAMDPDFAEAWNKRATAYYMIGDTRLSAADVKKTLELEPRHFGALSGLGLLYGQHGKIGAAIKAFEEALAVNPHLSGAKRNLQSLREELESSGESGKSSGTSI